MWLRPFRALTLLLAVGGVAAIVAASRVAPREVTRIGALAPSMNYAFVRLRGVILDFATVDAQEGYLAFTVQDESGQVRVQAYRQAAATLFAEGVVPAPGDRARVDGTLRLRDGEASLTLNGADGLLLERAVPEEIGLADLSRVRLGERIATRGQLRRARDLGGRWLLTLRDGTAEADVLLSDAAPIPEVGSWVRVIGGVGEYRGERQVLVASGNLTRIGAPAVEALPLGAVSRALEGQWVTTRGRVSAVSSFRGGVRLALTEGESALTLTAFDAVWGRVPFSTTLQPGDVLWVSGRLVDYRGALELQPELPADFVRVP